MTIYVDENMPPVFAEGFQKLQAPLFYKLKLPQAVEVKSIKIEFGQGVADEDWIPQLKGQQACVITQDYNIHRIRNQRALCEQYELGLIYLRPPSKSGFGYWEIVAKLVQHWEEILEVASYETRPFAYQITPRSKKLERF